MMTHPYVRKGKNLGFTLVETMVAIAILSIALLGPFYASQQSLTTSNVAKDKLTASMLSQEGIEFVRQIRDSNFLNTYYGGSGTWMQGLDGTPTGSPNCFTNSCAVDPTQLVVRQCVNPTCPGYPLYVSPNYIYTLVTTGNTLSKFTRSVGIRTVSATEVQVTATTSWMYHNAPNTSVITEYLTNWQ